MTDFVFSINVDKTFKTNEEVLHLSLTSFFKDLQIILKKILKRDL